MKKILLFFAVLTTAVNFGQTIYQADFSTPVGFEHSNASPPTGWPADDFVTGNNFYLAYDSGAPVDTDGGGGYFRCDGTLIEQSDFGTTAYFESFPIDITGISEINITGTGEVASGNPFNNDPTEYFQWSYQIDGEPWVYADAYTGTGVTSLETPAEWASLTGISGNTLTVRFYFNSNGNSRFEITNIEVQETSTVVTNEVLYSQDFEGAEQEGKGIWSTATGVVTDVSGVDWVIITPNNNAATFEWSGATADEITVPEDHFKVLNGVFSAQDLDGFMVWRSPTIDISGYTNVSFQAVAAETGVLENWDRIITQYRTRTDGNSWGAWTQAETNGLLINDFDIAIISQAGLLGDDLQIRFRVRTGLDEANEIIAFDDIVVTGELMETYCDSNPITGFESFVYINDFELNTISNLDSGASGYGDFTSQSTTLEELNTYTATITAINTLPASSVQGFSLFIDYNNDGDFDDPSETAAFLIDEVLPESAETVVNLTFTVPENVTSELTRLRIVMGNGTDPQEACGEYPFGETEDYSLNLIPSTTPITYIYNESTYGGWFPADPNGTALPNSNIVVELGTAVFNTNTTFDTMVVEPEGNLMVETGVTLTPQNTISLNSTSTQYPSLILDGDIIGDLIYSRHVYEFIPGPGGNDFISAPLTGQSFFDFAALNANIYSLADVSDKFFGPFDKSTGTFTTYDLDVPEEANAILEPAIGYRAASTDNGNFIFTGTAQKTDIAIAVSHQGPSFPSWNLIGNPYPSYIFADQFLADNLTLFASDAVGIYGYDGNDNYTVWNLSYAVANDAKLAPGQGFIIAIPTGGGGNAQFTTGMRTTGDTDDFVTGRSSNNLNLAEIKLKVSNEYQSNVTGLFFLNNGTSGLDVGYDTVVLGGTAGEFAIYSGLLDPSQSDKDFAIQTLAYDDLGSDEVIIPLGLNAAQGQQLTISMLDSNIPEGITVYLEDTHTNTFTLLNNNEYTFNSNVDLSDLGRFYIRFSNEQNLSLVDNELLDLKVYSKDRTIFISGQLTDDSSLEILDIQGKVLINSTLSSSKTLHEIDGSQLSTGVYIVKLKNRNQNLSKKLIIN